MRRLCSVVIGLIVSMQLSAQAAVDLAAYRAQPGLTATASGERLTIAWEGADKLPLRMQVGIDSGQPTIFALEYQRGSEWVRLARDLKPNWRVTTGQRRTGHGLDNEHRWDVFWDAPLVVPGPNLTRNPGLPRKPEEIGRYQAEFKATGCSVKTDGARLEITFPGVSMGIFAGEYRLTVYKSTNLVRAEVIAKTESPSVAYIYTGGLSGFSLEDFNRVEWKDVKHQPQRYNFDGPPDKEPVRLIARNRVAVVGGPRGSVATFPPSHIFFFAREVENNVGYVWQQKLTDRSFALGVRHNENGESYSEQWNGENWTLYNAPAGTMQRMAAYFYVSPDDTEKTRASVMAFTHNDRYKEVPGYKTMVTHFHTAYTMEALEKNDMNYKAPWMQPTRDLGVNIIYLCDFHGDGHPTDTGMVRLNEQKAYFELTKRNSEKDFLIVPGEEPNAFLGGHYNILFNKPVYWTLRRAPGAQFIEEVPGFGKVYHTANAADVFEMLKQEGALVWQTHPRTKSSVNYPDRLKDRDYFQSDHFLGAGYKNCPTDMSEIRMGEARAMKTLDDMNNWGRPKYLIAEVDTYKKYPEYDMWGDFVVNYVKMNELPAPGDFAPIVKALRAGEFFVTTGELVIPNWSARKVGANIEITADVEWTFPLEFVEVVWGDGQNIDRRILPATDRPAFGKEQFKFTLPAAGKKWVRFAAWDSAVNGGFTQPVHFE